MNPDLLTWLLIKVIIIFNKRLSIDSTNSWPNSVRLILLGHTDVKVKGQSLWGHRPVHKYGIVFFRNQFKVGHFVHISNTTIGKWKESLLMNTNIKTRISLSRVENRNFIPSFRVSWIFRTPYFPSLPFGHDYLCSDDNTSRLRWCVNRRCYSEAGSRVVVFRL